VLTCQVILQSLPARSYSSAYLPGVSPVSYMPGVSPFPTCQELLQSLEKKILLRVVLLTEQTVPKQGICLNRMYSSSEGAQSNKQFRSLG
jgi:hypothetical protein